MARNKVNPLLKSHDIQRELSDYIWKTVSFFRWNRPSIVFLLDLDDASQEILIHVWRNIKRWDSTRSWKPWVAQIIRRRLMNQVRDNMCRVKRLPLKPLRSRVIQTDRWGGEDTVWEPDMRQYQDGIGRTREALSELAPEERLMAETYVGCGHWGKTYKAMKIPLSRGLTIRSSIARKVKSML